MAPRKKRPVASPDILPEWHDPNHGDRVSPHPADHAPPAGVIVWQGLPILTPAAAVHLARSGLAWSPKSTWGTAELETQPVDAPDLLTPHLPPGQWPAALRPPGTLGDWVASLGDMSPDAVCAAWGASLAPPGVAVDGGCGVGGMARRMAQAGRPTMAFDRSIRAAWLTRDLLLGAIPDIAVGTHRGATTSYPWPHPPIDPSRLAVAAGDVLAPPLAPQTAAWLHLGAVLDMVPDGPLAVLEAMLPALQPGGLLTIATPYDDDAVGDAGLDDPEDNLPALLEEMGLEIEEEEPHVPWVVRQYNRGYRVLFTHCIAARMPR